MLRTSSHKNLEEFGKYLDIPIINGFQILGILVKLCQTFLLTKKAMGYER